MNHVCSFVRPSVRSLVTQFLENRSLLFSESLQLVRAFKRKKNVPSAFLIIFTLLAILAKNWPFGIQPAGIAGNPGKKTESSCF